jgi:hypothetical protein
MAYDPNPILGENRRGLRWYQIIALLVITVSLLFIAIATLQSAEADREQACWARASTMAQLAALSEIDANVDWALEGFKECLMEFKGDDKKN